MVPACGLRKLEAPQEIDTRRYDVNLANESNTETAMVAGIETGWRSLSLPENEPSDVAKSILVCATANRSLPSSDPNITNTKPQQGHTGAALPFSGKFLFVAGGQSYEIEDKMNELEPEWLGRENSRVLERGQEFLMREGTSWDTSKGI